MLLRVICLISVLSAAGITYAASAFEGLRWLWLLPVSFVGSYVGCVALVFLFLLVLSWTIDTSVPQEEDSKFMRWVAKLVCPAVFPLLLCKVEMKGLEKLPRDGRFMLVCNHLGYLDPILLMAAFPDAQLAFISKRENGDMFIIGKLMHRILTQKINRENDREALRTIISCIKIVEADKASIAVFPEGYTSLDAHLHHFRNGVFKIAQRANIPVVVCTLTGTEKAFRNVLKLRRTPVTLHLVDVIPAEDTQGVTTNIIGDRAHALMKADLGPVYAPDTEE